MAAPPVSSRFGEYMKRVSHIIALQGIFGVILLSTRYLPDRSMAIMVQGQEVLTLLDLNSLAVFALFLVLSIAILRQESDGTLEKGDPFLRVLEGYGSPSGSTTLFRVVDHRFRFFFEASEQVQKLSVNAVRGTADWLDGVDDLDEMGASPDPNDRLQRPLDIGDGIEEVAEDRDV
jgi:hypothetical protein